MTTNQDRQGLMKGLKMSVLMGRAMLTAVSCAGMILLASAVPGAAADDKAALVSQGAQVFKDQGCYGCHMVGKFGTPIATDLSTIGAKRGSAYLTNWLEDPSSQRPTAHMPKIQLNQAEVEALAAYLSSLR